MAAIRSAILAAFVRRGERQHQDQEIKFPVFRKSMQIDGYGLRVIHELRGNVHGVCDRRNRRGPVFEPRSGLIRR